MLTLPISALMMGFAREVTAFLTTSILSSPTLNISEPLITEAPLATNAQRFSRRAFSSEKFSYTEGMPVSANIAG